jgi:hypothetical protein
MPMTRNLSLIPTVEVEIEVAPSTVPVLAAPVRADPERTVLAAVRRDGTTIRAPAARSRALEVTFEAVKVAAILLLFVAVAWPLYMWIGR